MIIFPIYPIHNHPPLKIVPLPESNHFNSAVGRNGKCCFLHTVFEIIFAIWSRMLQHPDSLTASPVVIHQNSSEPIILWGKWNDDCSNPTCVRFRNYHIVIVLQSESG